MDIRWLCFACIIMLFSCSNLQNAIKQEDDFVAADSMHNYTNLKIFLWSGSGDGSNDEPTTDGTTTTAKIPFYSENPEDCIGGHDCNIRPTPVAEPHPGVIDIPQTTEIPDKEYWIVTELNSRSPLRDVRSSVPVITEKLADLYTIACTRRLQSRHLGLNANWTEDGVNEYGNGMFSGTRDRPAAIKVAVRVLSVMIVNGLDLVYFVTVNGRPVSAATAVRDMSLVTTREAANHLGYAVKTKARPYLVDASPHSSQTVRGVSFREIWTFVAVSSVVVLVVLVAGVVIAREKKRRKNSVSSAADTTNNNDDDDMAFRQDRVAANDRDTRTDACTADDDDDVIRTPEPKPRNRNKTSSSLLTMQAVNTFQKSVKSNVAKTTDSKRLRKLFYTI